VSLTASAQSHCADAGHACHTFRQAEWRRHAYDRSASPRHRRPCHRQQTCGSSLLPRKPVTCVDPSQRSVPKPTRLKALSTGNRNAPAALRPSSDRLHLQSMVPMHWPLPTPCTIVATLRNYGFYDRRYSIRRPRFHEQLACNRSSSRKDRLDQHRSSRPSMVTVRSNGRRL
jgi:hypothetical protein